MAEFPEVPYSIAAFDVAPAQQGDGMTQLVCYYLVTISDSGNGFHWPISRSALFGTKEMAEWWGQKERPTARVLPIALEFDLDDEAQLNDYLHFQREIGRERELLKGNQVVAK